MGSMSRFLTIERLMNIHNEEITDYFNGVIGLTIGKLEEGDIEYGYPVSAEIPLMGSSKVNSLYIHLDWPTEEEWKMRETNLELLVSEFNQYVAGRKITSILQGYSDRDNDVYLCANIVGYGFLEIPLGFNPETLEFYGYFDYILSKDKRKNFIG